jgi:hypothetical protein
VLRRIAGLVEKVLIIRSAEHGDVGNQIGEQTLSPDREAVPPLLPAPNHEAAAVADAHDSTRCVLNPRHRMSLWCRSNQRTASWLILGGL